MPPEVPASMLIARQLKPTDPCAMLLNNDTRLSRLAMEMARDLYPADQIFAAYGITKEDFAEHISCSAVFMTYYTEAREVWGSSTNAAQRVALKAGIQFEQWMAHGETLLHDPLTPAADKIKLATYLSRLAGFEGVHNNPAINGGGAAGTSTVVINLGHGRQIEIKKTQVIPNGDDAKEVLPTEVTTIDDQTGQYVTRPAIMGGQVVRATGHSHTSPSVQIGLPQASPALHPGIVPHSTFAGPVPVPSPDGLPQGESKFGASRGQLVNGTANPGPVKAS